MENEAKDGFTCKACRLYKSMDEMAEPKRGMEKVYEMIGPYCKECIELYKTTPTSFSGPALSRQKFLFFTAIGAVMGMIIILVIIFL